VAVPSNPDDAPPPAQGKHEAASRSASGAVRTLRVLVIGTIVVPIVAGAVGLYLSYQAHYRQAAAALAEAVAVAEENTTKILDTHVLVAARIDDLLSALPEAELRGQEKALHDRIAQQIEGLPQVAAAWVIDAAGRELVSARVFPVNRDLDHSGREDFRALQELGSRTYIWALRARSLGGGDYQPYFTVSQRHHGPDGRFRGVIVVAVSSPYFASFYNSLLGGSAQYAASVRRDDGSVLARYPEDGATAVPRQTDRQLAAALSDKLPSGVIASGSPFSDNASLVAFARLASYPVYVTIGRTRAAIDNEWLAAMAGYAAIGIPASIGLMLLSLLALRRTRREQQALARAGDAIAQRAAVEAQLQEAQKMEAVGLLTAGIAHDFNNLLTIVSGNLTLLSSDVDERRQRFVAAAQSGCERAAELTRRLLTFARREPLDPQPIDINAVITRMSDLARQSLGRNIAAEFHLAPDLWPVFVDPNQLENALINIALNARDAMAGSGNLTITTANLEIGETAAADHPGAATGDYVAIIVSDTGHGMPPEVRARAFDPFFTTKEAGKGTGLGLAQVNGFVTRSGGYCTIDSAPGRGTTVTLHLPRHTGQGGSDEMADRPGHGDEDRRARGDRREPLHPASGDV
jgi:signal transduction histidine kinase